MKEDNYDKMSYEKLNEAYLQKRDVVNKSLQDSGNSRRLSMHIPFFKRNLIEKIRDLDTIIELNKAIKVININSKVE